MWKHIVGNILLSAFLAAFVVVNANSWVQTSDPSYLLVALSETIFVGLYLFRQNPKDVSSVPLDWGIGFSGTFVGTLLRPATAINVTAGAALVMIGTLLNILAALSLGRSIGIVPALRTVKARGLYRFARHPMYASELCVLIGYFLGNASLWNLAIVTIDTALLLSRLRREEQFLSRSEAYEAYRKAVPWKLIPYIY